MPENPSPKKRSTFIFMLPLWVAIVVVFVGYVSTQTARYQHYRAELYGLQAALEAEQQTAFDLESQQFFFESDAYIEQLARERLGFVRPDEIVFFNIAN